MSKTFKTPKGTELPLMDLKGKDYLQPAYRIIWFREDHPDWPIETSYPLFDAKGILAKATIRDEKGLIRATAHRYEKSPDDAEKAETAAVGRALGFIGYGTQFAQELQDGDDGSKGKIADSPLEKKDVLKQSQNINQKNDAGQFVFNFDSETMKQFLGAKRYDGKKLKDIPRPHLEKIFRFCMDNEIGPHFCDACEIYLSETY